MRSLVAFLIFLYGVGFIGCKLWSPCPSGQFYLNNQCVLCHPTCTECAGHELFECTTCGVDEDGQERFRYQGRCRAHCPRGLYPDRVHYTCLPCIANCELCTDGNICAKCQEHYKLQNGVCQTASCDIGQVQDPDTGECIDCEMGCKTCSTVSDTGVADIAPRAPMRTGAGAFVCCVQHHARTVGITRTALPASLVTSSTEVIVLNSAHRKPSVMPVGGAVSLATVHARHAMGHVQQTVTLVLVGTLLCTDSALLLTAHWDSTMTVNMVNVTCVMHPVKPALARKHSIVHLVSKCLSCADGHYLESGMCRLNCSLRTYPADDGTCRRCPLHCDVCSDDRTCFKCSFLYLMLNGVCKASCPVGYYEDMEEGTCGQCHPTCGSCSGPLADDCETCSTFSPKLYKGVCSKDCPTSTFYKTEAMECQGDTDCPLRTYLHSDQFTCMGCHRHCYSCEGPGNDECLTCAIPKYLHSITERAPTVRNVTSPASCVQDQDPNPAGSVHLLFWNFKAPNCVLSAVQTVSISKMMSARSAIQVVRHAQGSALHAVENRCAHCCHTGGNDTDCCVCDSHSALCVEAPQPKSGDNEVTDLKMSSRALKHTSAALPIALLLSLGLALAVYALVKAHARKSLCWRQSYERLSGSASINMPHGVPEPDSGDEVDVVYTSRGGSVYRRYSFIHEQDTDADQDVDESTCLSQS
ncbi:Proprotein convertase subtilisin/kexin type 5 [Collichthys lucidus]|uniref:Proprotein convertase subtilisin/kexin type 5 n=1 Tax=Collichthys lucidus TaxID=240159 RepID=A0A4U5UG28_COLLU|nr:Proprotein convertase subtilisin/kexin type 5 [Collichthys lucidus]